MTENADSASIIDRAEALKFTAGDPEMLKSVAEMFLVEAPRQMQAIGSCIDAEDGDGIAKAAHQLKGSVVIFGAQRAAGAAIALELAAGSDRLTDVPVAWTKLQNEMEQLFQEIQKLATP